MGGNTYRHSSADQSAQHNRRLITPRPTPITPLFRGLGIVRFRARVQVRKPFVPLVTLHALLNMVMSAFAPIAPAVMHIKCSLAHSHINQRARVRWSTYDGSENSEPRPYRRSQQAGRPTDALIRLRSAITQMAGPAALRLSTPCHDKYRLPMRGGGRRYAVRGFA